MNLRLATAQFPTSGDPLANASHMTRQIGEAGAQGADLIHFCEGALSGYAPHDLASYEGYPWDVLTTATQQVVAAARAAGVWAAFGSVHRLSDGGKPHNSVYMVSPEGGLVDRYDKRFCAGEDASSGELALYTPGDYACVFEVKGVRLGVLICHEIRYGELYRDYAAKGVHAVLHSFHSANMSPKAFAEAEAVVGADNHGLNPATTIAGITQTSAAHALAADNHLWISCANSCAPRACWPSFVVRPDGVAVGRLEPEAPGVLITDITSNDAFYDATKAWRGRARQGVLHSGALVKDPRSADRTSF